MNLLSSLYGFAVCLEIIALLMTLRFLWNTINRFRRTPESRERRRSRKLGRDAFLFLSSGLLFFAGLAFLNFAVFLQTYRTFAIGEPVAQISILGNPKEQRFIAQIEELRAPLARSTLSTGPIQQEFQIHGDRWSVEGHIIRFSPWLSFLGFKPVYQLTRIQGSYYSIDDEQKQERTVYSLIDSSAEEWWRWMYKNDDRIPFMELMHGSAVSQDAKEGSRFVITVLPSGFSMQKTSE